jgi:predicted nucleotidyltransferase
MLATIDGVAEAYIYGSWAARYHGEPGSIPADVDVLVVGTAALDDPDDVADQAQCRNVYLIVFRCRAGPCRSTCRGR